MANDSQTEQQRSFLLSLLGFLDARRAAIDVRSSVVLAASSLALGLMYSQMKEGEFLNPGKSPTYVAIVVMIIAFFLFACAMSLHLIAPISRPRKQRQSDTRSLSWFWLIAKETKKSYNEMVRGLTDDAILEELSKQVVEISKLLRTRYERLKLACHLLYCGLFLLFAYTVLKVSNP